MAEENRRPSGDKRIAPKRQVEAWTRIPILLLASACALGCGDSERDSVTEKSVYIPPVLFSYDHWDHHLLQWLTNHPRYEIVEALIRDEEPPVIHFFFTEREAHNGSKKQFHYTNSPEFASRLADGAGDSDVQLVDIDYEPPVAGEKPTFWFELETLEGPTSWQFCANAEPDAQYAPGLVNNVTENAHNPKGGLLFFYLPESATSEACTSLTVADAGYPADAWPEISAPPYFVAYRGVYSRNVDLGYFYTTTTTRVRVDSQPSELKAGSAWSVTDIRTTEDSTRSRCLEVVGLDGAAATLSDGNFTYLTELNGEDLATDEISVTKGTQGMKVHFDVPVPDLRRLVESPQEFAFTISTASQPSLTTGILSAQRTGKEVQLKFRPQQPEFWQSTRLETNVELTKDGYSLESQTLYPGLTAD